ncbi:hypothetical protein GCM10011581_24940 [Saccharopolyspora subtropica]|uniref:ESX-1 secretion-associated protein EspA/EspE-like domain-containing protein n=1 Tax=Saccharopolyspora thermophila TaxID=89367 RepID=A0A917JUL0_9PSEU|nr:hypothetical protein [Saccharopolyspora subtropica]GGI86837.1 hypothetical protein GCM10011581_24940 [Saccharopolyspora subtropica]
MTSTAELLDELRATTDAVCNRDWVTGGLGGTGAGLESLAGPASSPLSALADAGFGFITASVSFLEEPLHQLVGDPAAISTGAQGFQDAGRVVESLADSYRQSTGPETSSWSGEAAAGYLRTAAELVDGLAGLGESSAALAEVAAGAGQVVAATLQEVTTLVQEATGRIIMILNQAVAAAQATFGASIAAAIPQAVQVAAEYGGRIVATMQKLLSSAQNLVKHVARTTRAVAGLMKTIAEISERCQATSNEPTSRYRPGTPNAAATSSVRSRSESEPREQSTRRDPSGPATTADHA